MCTATVAAVVPMVMVMLAALSHGLNGSVTKASGGTAGLPEILEEPTDEIVRRNDPLTLYCKATGDPRPSIMWYRTDSEAPLRDRDSRMQLPDGSLFFYRLRGRDRGTYYCVARNAAGTATSRRVTVQMAYLREAFRKSPLSLGVNEGESAVFECDPPKGHPTPVVTWRLDGRDLILPRHRYRQDGSTLMVSHVVPADEGVYQCVVTNMAGRRVSQEAQLTVYESARVGGVVKSMVGVAGHDVTLPCVPSGKPDPQVVWRRADGLMPVGRAAMGRDWSLTITALRGGDQGLYVCEATNSAGTHAANTSLLVVERPRTEGGVRPRIAVITPSHVRQIGCPITATPTPVIFWVKENHGRQEAERAAGETVVGAKEGGGEDVYRLAREQPWVVASDTTGSGKEGAARVDHAFNLHVTTHHEGLWACMAANEVGGVMMPVRVVGGGLARGTVSVGMVGVDEVEARAALLTPTLEQGFPSSSTPTTATVTWRLTHRPKHIEGIYVLGCERGSGFVPPRVQQQLQTHDISLLHHPRQHHARPPVPTTHTSEQKEDSSPHQGQDATRSDKTSLLEDTDEHILLEDEARVSAAPINATGTEVGEEDVPTPPRCSSLRLMGHTLNPAKSSYQVVGLHPYTSYWFLLLPHYKGVLGMPSNLQSFTTPQDVPAGWPMLSRWWAARVGAGTYALTLHWRPLPLHLAHGIIVRYQVVVRERDTGLTHNVSIMGDLTTLTLPNVTSSRVDVSLAASTIKGAGTPSPPTSLNLLMTHLKEPGVGVGMVRSAWFLVLAGGAVTVLVVLVGCTLAARWCAHSLTHSSLPPDTGHSKVGGPWVDVGGLWTPVPTHDLSSDKSERKLLANGSSSADYVEVEADSQLKDDLPQNRLEVWPGGLLLPSPSPSRASASSHHTKQIGQTESLPSCPARTSRSMLRQQTSGSHVTSSAHHISTCQDSDTGTWYTSQYCTCCREDCKLGLRHESFCPSATPSGCSTVLHVSLNPPSEYAYTSVGTDTYEAVTTYEEAGLPEEASPGKGPSSTRQMRLNTESTTDLSMDCYNYSDEDGDITHSCSDTEASFFIPHDNRRDRELHKRHPAKGNNSSSDDLRGALKDTLPINMNDAGFHQELQKVVEKECNDKDKKTLRHPNPMVESSSNSGTSSTKALLAERSKTISSRSSLSQGSLEEQFQQTLRMISQTESCNLKSDYLLASAFD